MNLGNVETVAAAMLFAWTAAAQAGSEARVSPDPQSQYAVAYQINPAHSGSINLSGGFKPKLSQAWTRKLDSALSYPLIAEGLVFTSSQDGTVSALDLSTGTTVWTVSGGSIGLAYDDGQLFVLWYDGLLSAYAAQTGASNWTTQLSNIQGYDSAPMAVNGQLYAGEVGGYLSAVDEATGDVQWIQPVNGGMDSSPAYGDGGIFVTYPGQYYDFNPATGAVIWCNCSDVYGGGGNTPVYFDRRLYVQDSYAGNSVWDAVTGVKEGSFDADLTSSPAVFGKSGKTYGVSLKAGVLTCWSAKSNKVVWKFHGDRLFSTSPIVINGHVLIGSGSGEVFMVDGLTGRTEWSAQTGAPVTSLAAGQGTLVAISGSIVTAFVPA
ncbi:MAG: PQQ-binding-like beta-propeller repeat protein [Rhizomicrobium sp.]|jgi:outer membrane protein assembly factor BamB